MSSSLPTHSSTSRRRGRHRAQRRTPAKIAARNALIGCSLCLGIAALTLVPHPASAAMKTAEDFRDAVNPVTGAPITRPADPYEFPTEGGRNWFADQPYAGQPGVLLVVTPGTDDGGLYPRIEELRGNRSVVIVNYPESLGPFVGGRTGGLLPFFAPNYDESRDIAITNNLAIMEALKDSENPYVIYTGYSQGAEALGNAAEQAEDGWLDPQKARVVLVSDPRSPWGLKSWVEPRPVISGLFELFGAESNGARNPADSDGVDVTSVIIVGDPVSNFQWDPLRPVSSLLVNAAGFATIHSTLGRESFKDLSALGDPELLYSEDGTTTYVLYKTKYHPLTLLAALLADSAGIPVSEATLDRWDVNSRKFYRLQEPSIENADPKVSLTGQRPDDFPVRPSVLGDVSGAGNDTGELTPEEADLLPVIAETATTPTDPEADTVVVTPPTATPEPSANDSQTNSGAPDSSGSETSGNETSGSEPIEDTTGSTPTVPTPTTESNSTGASDDEAA